MATQRPWDIVLSAGLGGTYWLALGLGDGQMLLWTMAAYVPAAATLFGLAVRRPGASFVILSAAAMLPSTAMTMVLLADMNRPDTHPCSIAPVLALFALVLSVAQLLAIGLIGGVIRAARAKPQQAT